MVMSIGWNPYFNNTEKTIVSRACFALFCNLFFFFSHSYCIKSLQEPWLLHDFKEDFYGEDLRLAIVGYIRPEVCSLIIVSREEKICNQR